MHLDIQNFSKIMDIDTSKNLIVEIDIINHRNPIYKLYINNKSYDVVSKVLINFDLLDSLNFRIECLNYDTNSAIEIKKISVNGNEIMPKYLHFANPPTHWIENINVWEFKTYSPFYTWFQEISGGGWVA